MEDKYLPSHADELKVPNKTRNPLEPPINPKTGLYIDIGEEMDGEPLSQADINFINNYVPEESVPKTYSNPQKQTSIPRKKLAIKELPEAIFSGDSIFEVPSEKELRVIEHTIIGSRDDTTIE